MRSKNGRYAGLPHVVMRSEDYRNLSGNAVKLLMALIYQFNGRNNGALTAAWSVMKKKHGFKSKDTLNRAKRQLLDADLIIQSRTPRFLNPGGQCALYAIEWQAIDECKGRRLEVKPTTTPHRKFSPEAN